MWYLLDELKFEWLWIRYCAKKSHNYFDKKKKLEIRFKYQLVLLGYSEILIYSFEEMSLAFSRLAEVIKKTGISVNEFSIAYDKLGIDDERTTE
jgi:hypothetical protein